MIKITHSPITHSLNGKVVGEGAQIYFENILDKACTDDLLTATVGFFKA